MLAMKSGRMGQRPFFCASRFGVGRSIAQRVLELSRAA
jgi:hypothetical protein